MNGWVLRVGDEVTITVPPKLRRRGYNPYPDGTRARVVGFGEMLFTDRLFGKIKAGVYKYKNIVSFVLETGKAHSEYAEYLEMVDRHDYILRLLEWQNDPRATKLQLKFISDLPETPFWQGDKVRLSKTLFMRIAVCFAHITTRSNVFVIQYIKYAGFNFETRTYRKFPVYNLGQNLLGEIDVSDNEIELVERGNVWKYYHNEPLVFANDRERRSFFFNL